MTTWQGVVKADIGLSAGELVDLKLDHRTGFVDIIKTTGEPLTENPYDLLAERVREWLPSHQAAVAITDALYGRSVFILRSKAREVLQEAARLLLADGPSKSPVEEGDELDADLANPPPPETVEAHDALVWPVKRILSQWIWEDADAPRLHGEALWKVAEQVQRMLAERDREAIRRVVEGVEAVLQSERFTYSDQYNQPAISTEAVAALRVALDQDCGICPGCQHSGPCTGKEGRR